MSADRPARAHGREQEPDRAGLVAMALDVYDMALEATHEHNGEVNPRPELQTALKALDLVGRLVGLLGDGRQMTRQQLEHELDRMGYTLQPKLKRAG